MEGIQHLFAAEKLPTLSEVIPTIETCMTLWEAKVKDPLYEPWHDAMNAGLEKWYRYYKRIDQKDWFVIAMGMSTFRDSTIS